MEVCIISGDATSERRSERDNYMQGDDVQEFCCATQEVKANLRIIGAILERTHLNKMIYLQELINDINAELGVKLIVERESKKRGLRDE